MRSPCTDATRTFRVDRAVWTHLGHAVARLAASIVGPVGFAVAGYVVRAPEDDSLHSEEAWLAISDQARIGSLLGEVDCAAGGKCGKNVVGGRRWRLYQRALLEARHCHGRESGANSSTGLPKPRAIAISAATPRLSRQPGNVSTTSRWQCRMNHLSVRCQNPQSPGQAVGGDGVAVSHRREHDVPPRDQLGRGLARPPDER